MTVGVRLIGLCSDSNSSHLRGAAGAPAVLRRLMDSGVSNLCSESGLDLSADPRFDVGSDFAIGDGREEFMRIESIVAAALHDAVRPLILGGDHAVTYPVMRAVAARHGPVNLLHFDAHPDLYDDFDGNRYSHASPFARIMESGLAKRLVQIGIRTMDTHQRAQARRFGVEVHEAATFDPARFSPRFDAPLYLSFDVDALDPAFAPGVSHHEPGGLTVRDALRVIQAIEAPLVGADIVEYNPRRDFNDMTAAVVLKLIKELGARMLDGVSQSSSGP